MGHSKEDVTLLLYWLCINYFLFILCKHSVYNVFNTLSLLNNRSFSQWTQKNIFDNISNDHTCELAQASWYYVSLRTAQLDGDDMINMLVFRWLRDTLYYNNRFRFRFKERTDKTTCNILL